MGKTVGRCCAIGFCPEKEFNKEGTNGTKYFYGRRLKKKDSFFRCPAPGCCVVACANHPECLAALCEHGKLHMAEGPVPAEKLNLRQTCSLARSYMESFGGKGGKDRAVQMVGVAAKAKDALDCAVMGASGRFNAPCHHCRVVLGPFAFLLDESDTLNSEGHRLVCWTCAQDVDQAVAMPDVAKDSSIVRLWPVEYVHLIFCMQLYVGL
jgi:hypothetical protein